MTQIDTMPKILIVDDVPGNIKILAEILKKNYKILTATSGKKALEIVSTLDIDLILLDVIMPEMDGYEVCKILKADKATTGIPVIFVTANKDNKGVVKGVVAGAVYYLTKPIDKDELKKLVRNVLQTSEYFQTESLQI
jgi:CheY-like chemotaxis protein